MATKKEAQELSVDEHNAEVSAKIAKLQEQIDDLKKTYKAESDKPQASLHDCLKKYPR